MSETSAPEVDPDVLVAAVEAILFAAAEPVQAREIAAVVGGAAEDRITAAFEALEERYARSGGGLRLERVAGAWRLITSPDVGGLVRQFFRQRNRSRLSSAGLETLAIVAYRQPITAPEIQAIRGVDPSGALRSLLEKKLVRILGRKRVVGNPLLYGTSKQFLIHFGLNRLEDLPSIDDFDQFLGALEAAETPLFADAVDDAEEGAADPAESAGEEE